MARGRAIEEAEQRHQTECTFEPRLITKQHRKKGGGGGSEVHGWQQHDDITLENIDDEDPTAAEGEQESALILTSPVAGEEGEGGGIAWQKLYQHPAKPKLNLDLKHPESIPSEVARYRREKDEYLRQARAEREIEELEKCTFQPIVNK